ncbi:MAG: 6-bladed beta-propeller [Clostridiales bacterium]|nr:6-bladed beta-propeller [Clostridiales bacterium]
MKISPIILIFPFLMLIACTKKNESNSHSIHVNIKEEAKVSVFDLFEKVEIIPLETSKKSLINDIYQVVFFDNRFFVLDYRAMRLLTFDNRGKYLGDVGKMGDGPGEFFNIGDFVIDKQKNIVSILTNTGSVYNYDINGRFIDNYRINSTDVAFHSFYPDGNDNLVLWNSITQKLSLYSNKSNIFIKTLYEEESDYEFSASVLYEFNNILYFTRSMSNEVYKLNKNEDLELSYRWDFGINNIDLTKLNLPKDLADKNMKIVKMFQDSEIPYILTGQNQNSICYYVKVRFNMEDHVNVFHFKKQNKQLVFKTFKEGLHFIPLYWTDEFVIGLGNISNSIAVNKSILNEENSKKFDSLTEISNPCLVKYHFRTDL